MCELSLAGLCASVWGEGGVHAKLECRGTSLWGHGNYGMFAQREGKMWNEDKETGRKKKIHGQERQFTTAAAAHHIYQAHRQALSLRQTNTSTPPPKTLLTTLHMYRTLIPCLRVGSWAGWLVRVWSLTRSNKDEENELIVNWMWSGLLLSDNTTYCTAAAVEPHHQHIAPWPLLFPPLLCPCKTLPPSEMLPSGHQRSKQWASAIKALILFSHQYQTCNLL